MEIKSFLKNLFIYTEPKAKYKFVLDENAFDKKLNQLKEDAKGGKVTEQQQEEIGMKMAQEAEQAIKNASNKPQENTAQKSSPDAAQKSSENAAQKSSENAAQKSNVDATQKSGPDAAQKADGNATQKSGAAAEQKSADDHGANPAESKSSGNKSKKRIKNAGLLYDKSIFSSDSNKSQNNAQQTKAGENTKANRKTEAKQHNKFEKETEASGNKDCENAGKTKISSDIKAVKEYMKEVYNIPTNGDIMIRDFSIMINDKAVDAFVIFFDGLVDRKVINDNILQPLMILGNIENKSTETDKVPYIRKHLLPQNQLKEENFYEDVIEAINFGSCGIFVDGCEKGFAADVKGWEHRNVEKSNNEIVLRGPQEGFNEILRVNTALIRKILVDEKLIVEDIKIGKRGKKACSMLYISDIANDSLVAEVRKRLKGLKIDYLLDSGELEQLIEDSTFLGMPQMLTTERPDRTAYALTEGRVAVLINGSPQALIMPSTVISLMSSIEDEYLRYPYSNFIKIVRIFSAFIALLLPGLYIAITNFHQEMIPSSLLLAIEAAREKVPFPTIIEILIMEVSFELIREAGVRIPGPIGPTLGIIGALILGQAAVAANVVSPILIIIVAVTGIGSFAIPNFNVAFGFRILKFAYIILGFIAGFLGLISGAFIHMLIVAKAKSFGVPFMAPVGPKTMGKSYFRREMWRNERRPDYVNAKADIKQEYISRKWKG